MYYTINTGTNIRTVSSTHTEIGTLYSTDTVEFVPKEKDTVVSVLIVLLYCLLLVKEPSVLVVVVGWSEVYNSHIQ